MERRYFEAKCDKHLGICLRMLYSEGYQAYVKVLRNDKGKIVFHISINADEDELSRLLEHYDCLIS